MGDLFFQPRWSQKNVAGMQLPFFYSNCGDIIKEDRGTQTGLYAGFEFLQARESSSGLCGDDENRDPSTWFFFASEEEQALRTLGG